MLKKNTHLCKSNVYNFEQKGVYIYIYMVREGNHFTENLLPLAARGGREDRSTGGGRLLVFRVRGIRVDVDRLANKWDTMGCKSIGAAKFRLGP